MKINFPNYVHNLKLPQSRVLYPLFEAISNSIDAINEHKIEINGKIVIVIERDPQIVMDETEVTGERLQIRHFTIKDNGVGFRDLNFNAFSELSSSWKKDQGGKGLGRVCWLKVFNKAEINSTYLVNGFKKSIEFDFICEDEPIQNVKRFEKSINSEIITEVKLMKCNNIYSESIPKMRMTIAEEIIRHFMPNFMVSNIPDIVIKEDGLDDIKLNNVFENYISEVGKNTEFNLKGNTFYLTHAKTKYHSQRNKDHRVYFIADGRVVESELVSQEKIPDIPPKLVIEEEDHVYVGYIESDYLNQQVNQTRDGFDIPKKNPEGKMFDIPDWEAIKESVFESSQSYLAEYLEAARIQKEKDIRKYINEEGKNYSYIFKLHKKELDKISLSDIRNGNLERELHRIHIKLRSKLKKEAAKVLSLPAGEISPEEYQEELTRLVEELNPTGKADLAEYIIHRRIVLDLLDKALKQKNNGKFEKEDVIHSYIFPIRASSDDITYEEHNLWLLDEKLAYNTYIASDKQFGHIPGYGELDSKEKSKRPDLYAYTFATVEPDEILTPFKALDVFEFKRPMRANYSNSENPYNQITEYLEIIRQGKATTKDGRLFSVINGGLIYCHIVSDFTQKLKDILRTNDFEQVGNEDWYLKFHKTYNAIIDVKSFDYILNVANKRNRILFDKLGLA